MIVYDDVLKEKFEEIAKKHGMQLSEISNIFESQFSFMRETIKALELEDLSEEEFNKLKTNFNIPNIGKLYTNYKVLTYIKKQKENARRLKEDQGIV